MADDLTPPQNRAVRLAITAAKYRTALQATAATLDRLAVETHRLAVTIRQLLQEQETDR